MIRKVTVIDESFDAYKAAKIVIEDGMSSFVTELRPAAVAQLIFDLEVWQRENTDRGDAHETGISGSNADAD